MTVRRVIAGVAILAVACATRPPSKESHSVSVDPPTEAVIQELVARDLMSHDTDQARTAATSACFVSFEDGSDPPREFLDRLSGSCAIVGPGSAAPAVTWGGVKTLPTGESAIRFQVGPITWRNADEAKVGARYYCGSLCSAAYLYVVNRCDEGWVVVSATLLWIS